MGANVIGPEIGPHGEYGARIVIDGDAVHAYEYGNRAHVGAWAKGARAGLSGPCRNPYPDKLNVRGRIDLATRGFRNAWLRGYRAARYLSVGAYSELEGQ